MTNKLTAVIYSKNTQECERMSNLLKSLGGEFHKYELGKDFTEKQFYDEFGLGATYPQISIGYKHIGGMKDTLQYMRDNNFF